MHARARACNQHNTTPTTLGAWLPRFCPAHGNVGMARRRRSEQNGVCQGKDEHTTARRTQHPHNTNTTAHEVTQYISVSHVGLHQTIEQQRQRTSSQRPPQRHNLSSICMLSVDFEGRRGSSDSGMTRLLASDGEGVFKNPRTLAVISPSLATFQLRAGIANSATSAPRQLSEPMTAGLC